MSGDRFANLQPTANVYVIKSAGDLPQQLDRYRIYHLLYDPGAGVGLYYSPDTITLVRLATGGGSVLPVGTVDNSLIRWDTGLTQWLEFTAFILPLTDGALDQIMQTDGAGTVSWVDVPASVADGTSVHNTLRWDATLAWLENSNITINPAGDIGIQADAAVGYVNMDSPIIFGPYTQVAGAAYGFSYNAVENINAVFIGGGLNFSGIITFTNPTFIYESFRGTPQINSGVNPNFAAYTVLQALPQINAGAGAGFDPIAALGVNLGINTRNAFVAVRTTTAVSGVSFASTLHGLIAGATLNCNAWTGLSMKPQWATVAGSVINFGAIIGLNLQAPGPGLFQPSAGTERLESFYGMVVANPTISNLAGNAPVAALLSNIVDAPTKLFLDNPGGAQSEFGTGDIHLDAGTWLKLGGTLLAPPYIFGFQGSEGALAFSTFFGVGGNALYLEGTAADEWIFRPNSGGLNPVGIGFDVDIVIFGTTAPTPDTNNYFVRFEGPDGREVWQNGVYSDVWWTAGGTVDINGMTVTELNSYRIDPIVNVLNGGTIEDITGLHIAGMGFPGSGLSDRLQSLWISGRSRFDGVMNYLETTLADLTADEPALALPVTNNGRHVLFQEADANGPWEIQGIVNEQPGDSLYIINTGANDYNITNEDAAAAAADRIITPTGLTLSLTQNKMVMLWYDPAATRWRVLESSVPGEQAGGSTIIAAYRFQTSIVEADPGNGNLRYDNATPASVTELYVSTTTDNGVDLTNILGFVSAGDRIYIQQDNDSTKYLLFDITANVDNATWHSFEGSTSNSGIIPDSNAKIHILILFGASNTGVTSFEGRVGAVTALQADYDAFFLTQAEGDALYQPIGTYVNTFAGRSGAVVPIQADYDAFFLTQAEGDALYQPLGTYVTSITGGTNINVTGTATVPIVNLDAAIVGVSVNGVTLNAAGAATSYLDESGNYSVPVGAADAVDSVFGRTGAVTALQADYDAFFLTQAEGDALYQPLGTYVTSITGGTNINVTGTATVPIVNLDAAIVGVSVNAVTLSAVGAATNFLNEAGGYTVPAGAGGAVDSVTGGTNINVTGTGADPIVNLDAAIVGVSVNGVTLSNAGAATSYLDETGSYSVPVGTVPPVDSVFGRTGAVTALQADYDAFFLTQAEGDALYQPIGTYVNTFNGRSGAVVPLQADYDAFFLTPAEGDAAYQPLGTYVTSITGGTNINVTGTATVPIVNLDAAIVGVSVNGVTLSNAGAATSYLNEAGGYSVPPDTIPEIGGAITNNQIAFGAVTANDIEGEAGLTWDGSTLFTDGNFEVQNTEPYTEIRETDAVLDEKVWRWRASAGNLFLSGYDDSDVLDFNVFQIFRTTSVVTQIDIQAQTVDIVGNLEISNVIYIVERATALGNIGGQGQLWAGTDQSLNFTDDVGTNTILTAGGGGIAATPTPAVNELAVWDSTGATLAGEPDLTFNGVSFDFRAGMNVRFVSPDTLSFTQFNIDNSNIMRLEGTAALLEFDGVNTLHRDNITASFGNAADAFMSWNGSIMVCDVLSTGNWSFECPLVVRSGNSQSWFDGTNNDRVTFTNDGTDLVVTEVGMDAMRFSSINLRFGDSDEVSWGNSDDMVMLWNQATTEFQMNLLGATSEFELRINGSQAIRSTGGGATSIGYNGIYPISTLEYFGTGNTSGGQILAHSGHGLDIGFNELHVINDNVSDTLEASHCGQMCFKDASTARTLTLASNVDLDFPVSGLTTILNAFTSGLYTVTEGASTTLYVLDGTTRVDSAGGITIDPGGVVNVWRESATVYYCWGSGINP